jgi:hypothetical protein
MPDHWERRTYVCAVCRTEAFDYAAPIGWLRVQWRIESDAQGDTFKIVGFYCKLPCLASDVDTWMARASELGIG